MTWKSVPHTVNRLVIDIDSAFDDFRDRYEAAVPAFDLARFDEFSNWDAVVDGTAKLAPHGFLRYGSVDAGTAFALAGHKARAITYLMGNHTIAETMYGIDPAVMLYAPLRTVLYQDLQGGTHFAVDQPSTRFASFEHPDLAATGQKLDEKLAALLAALDAAVPDVLMTGSA